MDTRSRLLTTLFIWAVGIVAVSSMNDPFHSDFAGFAVIAALVLFCMGFVWNWGMLPLRDDQPMQMITPARAEKAKRSASDKAALLRELLDDDELEALKARLMDDVRGGDHFDDGELPLARLLDRQNR